MAQLLVRNLEEIVVKKLRQKAAENGISMEEEHRRILRSVLAPASKRKKVSLKEALVSSPLAFTESELRRASDLPRKIEF